MQNFWRWDREKHLKGFARQIDRKVKVIGIGKLEDLVRYVEKE